MEIISPYESIQLIPYLELYDRRVAILPDLCNTLTLYFIKMEY